MFYIVEEILETLQSVNITEKYRILQYSLSDIEGKIEITPAGTAKTNKQDSLHCSVCFLSTSQHQAVLI